MSWRGRFVLIESRYRAALQKILDDRPQHPAECDHRSIVVRARVAANGVIQYAAQCTTCGRQQGGQMKHADAPPNAPPWDAELEGNYHAGRSKYYRDVADYQTSARETLRRQRAEVWDKLYRQYLASDEWRERREQVLSRCNKTCEGCLSAPASQVHHLTYDHVGAELFFELVGICRACHETAHEVTTNES